MENQTAQTAQPEQPQTEQPKSKRQRVLTIVGRVVAGLLLALAVFMMIFTIVSVTTFDRTDRSLFGYKTFIVLSDSMKATDFAAGDLIFVKEVDPATLEEGDIICFQSTNEESYGEIITHKIRSLTKDADGNPGFVTYGTTTDTNDEKIVTYPFVIGEYQGRIAGMGTFFQFLKTTPGYIVCILLPFLLLIGWQGVNAIRTFRRYKKLQRAELVAEREKLEAERAEAQRMMAELKELKARLGEDGQTLEGGSEGPQDTPKDGGTSSDVSGD